jgi:hypothetical protein
MISMHSDTEIRLLEGRQLWKDAGFVADFLEVAVELIAVVEAAEAFYVHVHLEGGCFIGCPMLDVFGDALAALDAKARA